MGARDAAPGTVLVSVSTGAGLRRPHNGRRLLTTQLDSLRLALMDRYTVERELGAGGMATVYLATDLRHDRAVAVKVLRPDLSASVGSERFLQEIRIAARLNHPHILPLLDSGSAGAAGDILYYVMPYVKGESLRERLAREGELPVPDAVRVMRDVADALTHAHEHGVVHRDIKPENILLSGRHALVADFGVAKAVSDATGRSQVTTAGVALGTPAYMAPEQAAADPHVDHRADIYALGVVGYEMIAGEPPFTGNSPQQVLAAQVTETPRPVTARRPVVPAPLADAIMRCLEKKAADRWQTAGALLTQLEAVQTPTGGTTPTDTRPYEAVSARRPRSRAILAGGGAAVLLAVAALGVFGGRLLSGEPEGSGVTLRDRVQLTTTGRVQAPAISLDGKQLAYVTQTCPEAAPCSHDVEVIDLGGTAGRKVLEGAASAYFIEWSPDRRHLLVTGTINRRWGAHLVPLLGGPPRRVATGNGAAFFAGGDSIIAVPAMPSQDSMQWLRVLTLDGGLRDSIRLRAGGLRVAAVAAVPNSGWIIAQLIDRDGLQLVVLDRNGVEASRSSVPFTIVRASSDAVWLAGGNEAGQTIRRMAFDAASGRIDATRDTVHSGRFTSYSVTADGTALAIDEGSYQHSLYALPLDDLLAGRLPESRRIVHGSTPATGLISQDGARILLRRRFPTASGTTENRWFIRSFDDGTETPLAVPPGTRSVFWEDSATLAIGGDVPAGSSARLMDVATGAVRHAYTIPDSALGDWDVLPNGGWIWVTSDGERLGSYSGGTLRSLPKPSWYDILNEVSASPDGRVLVNGWNVSTSDSLRISAVDLDAGTFQPWMTDFSDGGDVRILGDGSAFYAVFEADQTAVLYHITGPGVIRRLGMVPRPILGISVSDDLQRAVVGTQDYVGDVWLSRVVPR